ncbi:hypothetical protein CVT26_007815 [Gymnopilus dilepis]|uniref:ATP-dependent DNA helicase n=1 Tax=Gymnopilus dilepis TaxID=231916 RepID=A0A409W7Q1_9AGAR|nr:hypothetical protein CVT26_007815 [Gymnopilus dilepis]
MSSTHADPYTNQQVTSETTENVAEITEPNLTHTSSDTMYDHLRPADDKLKLELIRKWEELTSYENIRIVVCSVCGERHHKSNTALVDGLSVDLSLLRNDELPEDVRPSTYNFIAYDRAILNPKGLTNRDEVGDMVICSSCKDNLESGVMPKFALANWLYYGIDELPTDISNEFASTSIFERTLIARARSNSICCKFNASDDNGKHNNMSHLRKGIRGNVMVAPLDAIKLYKVLPPNINERRDTISAVIVGDRLPSRDTIMRLGPILVRKSRIQKLLQFLIMHNPYYREGPCLSYSQSNLDDIHDNDDEPSVPKSVTIGQLQQEYSMENANSDYTPRNESVYVEATKLDELVMENVSYTDGDESATAYHAMKILALERCLSGKPFLSSGTGSTLVRDFDNPCILTWLFPHLDPWGIGGFHEPKRIVKLTMKEQLEHLLKSDNRSFEEDPEFAFTVYNILRKIMVSRSVRFQVPKHLQNGIVEQLMAVDLKTLCQLREKFEKDARYRPLSEEERKICKLLKSITMTTRSLPGSNGYKTKMRDQIKAIINAKGSPTLFITINPSDVDHPLVRIFAGKNINLDDFLRGEDMESWERKVFAAKHPAASAMFFDFMIKGFIKIILGHGMPYSGLFGHCESYFGTVEAQGKGTLHCHMLVWLRGHLHPQRLREQLLASEDYRSRFITWLESIVMNEFPIVSDKREDEPERLNRVRCTDLGEPHPGSVGGPSLTNGGHNSEEEFWREYKEHVIRLVNEYNWHEHTATCFKYVRKGEVKNDKTCRMRMDGIIHQETTIAQDNGYIQLRRLHPWVASYSDLVIFLMKCNVNLQFIGSGDAARAFIYYVTDYLTKIGLPIHAGLAAISYVITKTGKVQTEAGINSDLCTSAMIKIVNSMMGRQEISHQQVMSYIVGGGDHYTSEKFASLHLGAFIRSISTSTSNVSSNEIEGYDLVTTESRDTTYLTVEDQSVSISNQVYDYIFRPSSEPYNSMCLYDFVARTDKTKIRSTGRPAKSSDTFAAEHPQKDTHRMCKRSKPVIPVIVGPYLPKRQGSVESELLWCRQILLLFKPWREANDIKGREETFLTAYQAFEEHTMNPDHKRIIENMCLLSECKDACSALSGRNFNVEQSLADNETAFVATHGEHNQADIEVEEDLQEWKEKLSSDVFRIFENTWQEPSTEEEGLEYECSDVLTSTVGQQVSSAFDACMKNCYSVGLVHEETSEQFSAAIHGEEMKKLKAIMTLKRKRRLDTEDTDNPRPSQKTKLIHSTEPFVDIHALSDRAVDWNTVYQNIVENVIREMNLLSNADQLDAFMTVANHLAEENPQQLLMFVSGVGGTGKSHVIKAIVRLFENANKRKSLLLGAPTGSAALLIGGSTLHSLILETTGASRTKNMSLLTAIWKGVKYLIIDEVSMLGAKFLSKLCNAMRQAKGDEPAQCRSIFGGVNVIFMGDLCQLKPPKQNALYATSIVDMLTFGQPRDDGVVSALNGVALWRQVNKIVELKKNCRHASDPKYSNFLSRLRVGKCFSITNNAEGLDDYAYLQNRLLTRIQEENPAELASFSDAPVIVGLKSLRDALNARMIIFRARSSQKPVHLYYSKDFYKGNKISHTTKDRVWDIPSSDTDDSFGRLPLFEGMKVMITENVAFDSKIVNGTEGTVRKVMFEEDEEGRRYATVAYIHVEGSGFNIPNIGVDVVPIFPRRTQIRYLKLPTLGLDGYTFSRYQLPVVPAYAYTDFKSQGKTLQKAIVDLVSAKGQGVYVMLSRVTSMSGVAILRWFPPSKVYSRLSGELRNEMQRLHCQM